MNHRPVLSAFKPIKNPLTFGRWNHLLTNHTYSTKHIVHLHITVLLMIQGWRLLKLRHEEDHFTAVPKENKRSEE